MKRIVQAIGTSIRVVLFMVGVIMCMSDTSNITTQISVSLTGMALMIIISIIQLRKETQWEKT